MNERVKRYTWEFPHKAQRAHSARWEKQRLIWKDLRKHRCWTSATPVPASRAVVGIVSVRLQWHWHWHVTGKPRATRRLWTDLKRPGGIGSINLIIIPICLINTAIPALTVFFRGIVSLKRGHNAKKKTDGQARTINNHQPHINVGPE